VLFLVRQADLVDEIDALLLEDEQRRRIGAEVTSSELSPPPTDRQPLDAGVVRTGVLTMLALIVGSMLTYELVRSTSPLPRPRPSASSAALAANPAGQLPSNSASAPRKTRG
jgi:hypothetical protein